MMLTAWLSVANEPSDDDDDGKIVCAKKYRPAGFFSLSVSLSNLRKWSWLFGAGFLDALEKKDFVLLGLRGLDFFFSAGAAISCQKIEKGIMEKKEWYFLPGSSSRKFGKNSKFPNIAQYTRVNFWIVFDATPSSGQILKCLGRPVSSHSNKIVLNVTLISERNCSYKNV